MLPNHYPHRTSLSPKDLALKAAILLILVLVLAGFLAWISTHFSGIWGWSSFFWVGLIGAGALVLGWRLVRAEEPPGWLFNLMLAAAVLRLAAGVIWFLALPAWGHATNAERLGYVMGDAAGRDQAAWRLAKSEASLLNSFQDNRKVDQYGGQLFTSAAIYRCLGSSYHQPLLIVVLGAAFSSLAVLFGWAFARRIWGSRVAAVTAWVVFLYPEAVLLGSSQMREAFTIPLVAAAFYGLARYKDDRSKASLAWVLIPFLLTFFFSPLSAVMLLGALALTALVVVRFGVSHVYQHRWFWLILAILVLVGLAGLWLALREATPDRITNPIAMASWWLRKSASFQAYTSQHASGWMQKIFKFTPAWTHLPMLLAYGVVQPFLPAALVAGSQAPIWRWIAVWRSVGWTSLLAFLAFAPFFAARKQADRSILRMVTLVVWLVILVAAFRGGSDMWDNPRYRAIFLCLQIGLAAKILVEERQAHDPWLRRALLLAGTILAWFLPWYVQRYFGIGWIVTDPFRILGLGAFSGALLVIADWVKARSLGGMPGESAGVPVDENSP